MSMIAMKKLTLLLCGDDVDKVIHRLMYLKCVDVARAEGADEFGLKYFPAEDRVSELEAALEQTKRVMVPLRKYNRQKKPLFPKRIEVDLREFIADGRYEKTMEIVRDTDKAVSDIALLDADKARLKEKYSILEPWRAYDLPLSVIGTETSDIVLGSFPMSVSEERLAEAMQEGAEIDIVRQDKIARYVAVFYHKDYAQNVSRALNGLNFTKASFTGMTGTPVEEITALDRALEQNEKANKQTVQSLFGYAEHLDEVEILYDAIKTELNAAESKLRLARSEVCSLMTAWVPVDKVEKVTDLLSSYDCAYEFVDPTPEDDPPVLLKNNAFAKNFEWVVGMYSYPKYGTYDPTFAMGIFYCLIFGMMFADVGYGILMMLACFLGVRLIKPKEGMKRFLLMFGWCGLGSTLMGVLFGGYFGDMPQQIMTNLLGVESVPSFAILADPMQDPMKFLIISMVMGGIHLISGMALKMYITWRNGHPLDAILDTVPWWILFAGIGLIFAVPSVGKWVTIVGVVAMVLTQGRKNKNIFSKLGGGFYSLYGLVNFASDLVSYSRIMALGLASAVVAQVVNILGTMIGGSVVGTFFMIVVFIIGHALNMAINILGSFVHTSRLQYIEFFGKFFEEGGHEFRPVAPADQYTTNNSN